MRWPVIGQRNEFEPSANDRYLRRTAGAVKGFRRRPVRERGRGPVGRRPKASEGGNRGLVRRRGWSVPRLWGFRDWSAGRARGAKVLGALVEVSERAWERWSGG